MYSKDHESEEMYLETILILLKRNGKVRSVDIVEELDYAKSSVSRGVNLLEDKGYINFDHNSGDITLTESGYELASSVYEKHLVFKKLLQHMGANEEMAADTACRMEHVVSDEMFGIIKDYIEKQNK